MDFLLEFPGLHFLYFLLDFKGLDLDTKKLKQRHRDVQYVPCYLSRPAMPCRYDKCAHGEEGRQACRRRERHI